MVIAGSNGYDKSTFVQPGVPVSSFDLTANISGSAITVSNSGVFLVADFFAGPYDPTLCGAYALSQTEVNRAAATAQGLKTYQPVNFFNAYMVYKNSYAVGTYCSLYNAAVDASYASKVSVNSGNDNFSVQASWTYTLSKQDSGNL